MYANVLPSISVTKRLFIFGQTLGNSKCNRDRHIKLGKKFGFFKNEKSWARMIWSFRIWKNIANRTTFGRDTEGFRPRSTPLLLLLLLLLVNVCSYNLFQFCSQRATNWSQDKKYYSIGLEIHFRLIWARMRTPEGQTLDYAQNLIIFLIFANYR